MGSKNRKYRLYVPNNVKENTALVFCLHGTMGSSDNKQPVFDAIANSEGIIVVYGHGENVWFPYFNMNAPGWNSTGEWSADIDIKITGIEVHSFDPNSAGISDVRNSESHATGIYTLSGTRLDRPMRGVNIIDGKKVVVRE